MKLHIFVGVYDGVIDVVEPYVNEADAKRAWSEYTEMDYSLFESDDSVLEDTKQEGSTIYICDINEEGERETRHHDCPFCGKQWREYCEDDNYPNYCPGCGDDLSDRRHEFFS